MLSGWHYSKRLSYMISLNPQKECVYFSILIIQRTKDPEAGSGQEALPKPAWFGLEAKAPGGLIAPFPYCPR